MGVEEVDLLAKAHDVVLHDGHRDRRVPALDVLGGQDLDAGVLLDDFLEAHLAVGGGVGAGRAHQAHDLAGLADLLDAGLAGHAAHFHVVRAGEDRDGFRDGRVDLGVDDRVGDARLVERLDDGDRALGVRREVDDPVVALVDGGLDLVKLHGSVGLAVDDGQLDIVLLGGLHRLRVQRRAERRGVEGVGEEYLALGGLRAGEAETGHYEKRAKKDREKPLHKYPPQMSMVWHGMKRKRVSGPPFRWIQAFCKARVTTSEGSSRRTGRGRWSGARSAARSAAS